ncbi:MAG: LicD family protein [Clostridia bacterium]|nr:LicD family protein [Clostridia bacterium]
MNNGRILTTKEIQTVELEILKAVKAFCEQNGIRYFLAGGTLLGAVRHKGFIPWDNDIDIAMPRPDYETFRKTFGTRGPYRVMGPEDGNDYIYPFIKVVDTRTRLIEQAVRMKIEGLGLYIDVFPVDGFGDDRAAAEQRIVSAFREGYHLAYTAGTTAGLTPVQKAGRIARKIRCRLLGGRERAFARLCAKLGEHPFDASRYVGSTFGLRSAKELIAREAYATTVPVLFEGEEYPAPAGWDAYLTQMYGDYMQLPPESERVANHDMDARWTEET